MGYLILLGSALVWYTLAKLAEWVVYRPPGPYFSFDGLQFIESTPFVKCTSGNKDAFTVIYSHGNACNIPSAHALVSKLSNDLKADFFLYDYYGYGPGTYGKASSEKATYRDIRRIYDHVRNQGVPPDRIILMGVSLGSGPTFELATQVPIGGIIIVSGYTSIVRIANIFIGKWFAELLAWIPYVDIYENLSKVDQIDAPVYLVHGLKDPLITISHCDRMTQALSRRNLLWRSRCISQAAHNNMFSCGYDMIIADLRYFLDDLRSRR